jgi:DNA-binding GntR family transcriptional regulator
MDHVPSRSGRQAREAYRAIHNLILEGVLRPGGRLSHRSLAENLGVGRGAVRDAILRLEAEGLLEQRQRSGVSVRGIDQAEIADVLRLRAFVEPLFAERAAIRRDARQVEVLESLCDAMDAERPLIFRAGVLDTPSWRRAVHLDMEFHAAVIAAAGKWALTRFYHHEHVLALHGAWYVQHQAACFEHHEAVNGLHREMAAAIRRQDPAAAAEASRRHNAYFSLELGPP